jgi:hypothetical protein
MPKNRGATDIRAGSFADETLHRLISRESDRRKIPLPLLVRATLLAGASGELEICGALPLSPDWRDRLRQLAAVVELQRGWGWWHQEPWSDLKLLRAKSADYTAWLDGELISGEAGQLLQLPPQHATDPIYRTGLPGKPSSWHLIEAECQRRFKTGDRHSTAEWARVLNEWLREEHPDAPITTEKTLKNKLPGLLRELEAGKPNSLRVVSTKDIGRPK